MSKIIKSNYVVVRETQNIYGSLESLKSTGDIDAENYLAGVSHGESSNIINDAIKEAKEIIEAANEYKNNVLASVIEEIEEHRRRGYESGYAEAYEKGKQLGFDEGKAIAKKEVEEKNKELVNELCKQIDLVEESKDELIKRYEKDLVKLAAEISEKIIRVKISKDDEIIKNILSDAIKDYRNVEWLKIYLSKNDYITVSTDKNIMEKLFQISEHVVLETMLEGEDGDLIIESPDNLIDLGINTQLINLKKAII